MASSSKCPKCENSTFELAIETPKKANYKFYFIRCSSCGTVVGTHEYYHIGALIHQLAEKLHVKLD
jgi:hypothetical protein